MKIKLMQNEKGWVLKSTGMVPTFIQNGKTVGPNPSHSDVRWGLRKSAFIWKTPDAAVLWASRSAEYDLQVEVAVTFGSLQETTIRCQPWSIHHNEQLKLVKEAVRKLTKKPDEGEKVSVYYAGRRTKLFEYTY